MLIDRYEPEDVFARVPELADQTDPVLRQLNHLLDDDLYQEVRHDLAQRYRLTPVHGRHSTPAAVLTSRTDRAEAPGTLYRAHAANPGITSPRSFRTAK